MNLCAPSGEFSCFACCPPIRPSGYDHLDYRSSIARELSDNRAWYLREGPRFRPIVGFSCWALGFLDPKGHRAGCLLHPCQNGGEDLRHLVNYGSKCSRETCLPARTFDMMPMEQRRFWLGLVAGFDSFRYSSPRENPLFRILLWDNEVLDHLQSQAAANSWGAREILTQHPFIMAPEWNPRAHRYLFRMALTMTATAGTPGDLEKCARNLWERISAHPLTHLTSPGTSQEVATHSLPMERDFLDFVRLALGWRSISTADACTLQEMTAQVAQE